jgi:hypothetical protein
MKSEDLNLSKMTVEDLFRAKQERRQRLAGLPFEQKIEIVRRLQSVSPMTQVGFFDLVHDDLLAGISLDLGIQISRVSPAMIPHYSRGQWLYTINQYVITIIRWSTGKEASVQGLEDLEQKPRLILGAQLRAAIDSLRTDGDEALPQYEIWHPEYWRRRFPISFLSFAAANGIWIAEWFVEPVLTQSSDFILFDIKFNSNVQKNEEKRLQLQIHTAALSQDSAKNLQLFQPHIMALLEGTDAFRNVRIQNEPDDPAKS